MNERIDVLCVMAAAASRVELSGAPRYAVRINKAREAIAEVIAAHAAVIEMESGDCRPSIDVERAIYERRDVAIANIGGANGSQEAVA